MEIKVYLITVIKPYLINGDVEFTNKNSMKFETSVAEFDFKNKY